jgi:hypothetical protein
MKDLFSYVIAIILVAFIVCSCKTDFDINAPYKPIPVVYGLLDQSQDTQFVKINKSFIGGGNNVDYAAINDSLLFTNVSARVEQYSPSSSSPFKVHDLQELWVDNLQSGIFYTDSQKVYYFIPDSPLNDEHFYRLVVSVGDLQEEITAETYLVDGDGLDFQNSFKYRFYNEGINFVEDVNLGTIDDFKSTQVKWNQTPGGKRYELLLRFRFNEVNASGLQEKNIYWNLGTQIASGNDDLIQTVNGEQFFKVIDNVLEGYAYENQVVRREIKAIDLILTAGSEDLHTYMEVNEPATGVVTERPSFTNINGDGIGLFSSKYQVIITSGLGDGSVLELCKGQLTGGADLLSSKYKFCTDSIDQIQSIFTGQYSFGENCGCN